MSMLNTSKVSTMFFVHFYKSLLKTVKITNLTAKVGSDVTDTVSEAIADEWDNYVTSSVIAKIHFAVCQNEWEDYYE